MKAIICKKCRRIVGYQAKDPDGQETIIKNSNYNTCNTCGVPICTGCLTDGTCETCIN